MRRLALTAALGASCLALAACGGGDREANNMASDANMTGTEADGGMEGGGANMTGGGDSAGGNMAGSAAFPTGARIVEENGVTYRVDANGARVQLGDSDSRILVENGVRYRVDPGGSRVRINEQGAALDVDLPDVDLPDVDVGINDKGNPDVDVKNTKDGNDGPN